MHARIGPPVPGRDADLLREVVDPENGAALAATRDHQRMAHAKYWPVNYGRDSGFPFAGNSTNIEFMTSNQIFDQGAHATGADNHDVVYMQICARKQYGGWKAGRAVDVTAEVSNGTNHVQPVAAADQYGSRDSVVDQSEGPSCRAVRNIVRFAKGVRS